VISTTGLRWFDIPSEREARITAKRIGENLCGADKVQYIDRKISEHVSVQDTDDWELIKQMDLSTQYDLAQETQSIFSRLKEYRPQLQGVLDELKDDADFKDIDLCKLAAEKS
jgi:hypothetical protein